MRQRHDTRRRTTARPSQGAPRPRGPRHATGDPPADPVPRPRPEPPLGQPPRYEPPRYDPYQPPARDPYESPGHEPPRRGRHEQHEQYEKSHERRRPAPPRQDRPGTFGKSPRRRAAERRAAERKAAGQRRSQRREAARHHGLVRRVLTHNATIATLAIAALFAVVTNVDLGESEPPPVAAENLSANDMLALLDRSDMDAVTADVIAKAKERAHAQQVRDERAAKAKAKRDAKERARVRVSESAAALARRNTSTGQNKAFGKQLNALKGWSRCWPSLSTLWDHESNWNERAVNPSSGAYGIPQALPAGKLSSAGSDWRTSAPTQIAWGLGYIKARYGDPCGAWRFWQAHNWY